MRLTMSERRAVIRAAAAGYRKAGKKRKGQWLDELVALTGYHRWYEELRSFRDSAFWDTTLFSRVRLYFSGYDFIFFQHLGVSIVIGYPRAAVRTADAELIELGHEGRGLHGRAVVLVQHEQVNELVGWIHAEVHDEEPAGSWPV